MNNERITGSIIAMAFPDNFVSLSNEGIAKITPLLGIGNKHGVKVGHAALCTVDHTTGNVSYYDFGRYITPYGKGRVRSITTDDELLVPIKAIIKNGVITNIDEILLWLEAHPEKTHGGGTLVASVCSYINLEDAELFIQALHTKGSIPYGVFVAQGSNCARFVFDTILASCEDPKTIKRLAWEKVITPSPLGILSRASSDGKIYKAKDGIVSTTKPFSTIGSWKYFFDKPEPKEKKIIEHKVPKACYLDGIGSSAYFTIEDTQKTNEYIITRYTEDGTPDCSNIFKPTTSGFRIRKEYNFVYDSNCDHCHIKQGDTIYRFNKK